MSPTSTPSPEFSGIIPAYYQLQQALVAKIMDGTWKAGEQIPSERELALTFGLSIGTVKKAILNMVQAGYCYRVQGKGSFVTKNFIDRNFIKYYRMKKNFTDVDASISVQCVSATVCAAPPEAQLSLPIAPNKKVIEISRIFYCNEQPIAYTASYFDSTLCKPLLSIPKSEFEALSLYVLIEKYCHIPTIHCEEILRIEDIPEKAGKYLGIEARRPVLSVLMLGQTYDFKPYEYRISYVDTSEYGLCREHVFKN